MGKKKTVLIIDDHPLFREGIKSLFARQSLFNLIGEAKNGKEGIKKAIDLKPDIVVMDLSLPDQNGMEVTRKILDILPKTHIMILSMHSKVDYIIDAFRAGAKGYVIKESAAERLIECLKSVSKGEYFLDPFLSHMVAKNLMESDVKTSRITDTAYGRLTPREQQVMRFLAEGFSTKEIAKKLFISPKTVENHRANIMNKLDIHSTLELIRYAARLGLIDVDLWKS